MENLTQDNFNELIKNNIVDIEKDTLTIINEWGQEEFITFCKTYTLDDEDITGKKVEDIDIRYCIDFDVDNNHPIYCIEGDNLFKLYQFLEKHKEKLNIATIKTTIPEILKETNLKIPTL